MFGIRRCGCCGDPVEVKIVIREYGFSGVIIECPNCHLSMRNSHCCEQIRTEKRIATPITESSLNKCLWETIRMWNTRSKNANTEEIGEDIEVDANAWIKKHWGDAE